MTTGTTEQVVALEEVVGKEVGLEAVGVGGGEEALEEAVGRVVVALEAVVVGRGEETIVLAEEVPATPRHVLTDKTMIRMDLPTVTTLTATQMAEDRRGTPPMPQI